MADYDYDTIEYYHDQARDFAAEVHHCHNRINILELQLNEKRREAASARLHVQALKNDLSAAKKAWRYEVASLRGLSIRATLLHELRRTVRVDEHATDKRGLGA